MTDTRSVPRSEEDPNELLAEFDELLADGSTDEALSVASTEGGSGVPKADENAPAEDLEDLEALFDTFYDEAAPGGSGGVIEPAGEGARAEEDSDGNPVSAESPGPSTDAVTEAEPPRDALPAAEGAPFAGAPVDGDAGVKNDPILSADSEGADPAEPAPAGRAQSDSPERQQAAAAGAPLPGTPIDDDAGVKNDSILSTVSEGADPAESAPAQPESQPAAAEVPAEAVTADPDSVVAAAETAKEPGATPEPSAKGPGQDDAPGEAESSRNQKQTSAEKEDPEAAEEVFPFVPAGTPMDDSPRRTHPESTPASQGGSGAEGNRKLAFVAGGVMALIAAGAGLLAWEAHSGVAALNERLAGRPASTSESPTAAVEAMERRLDELNRRLEALAASAPEQGSELSELRAEVQAAAGRVAGLDARLEALRVRVATPDAEPSEPANAASVDTGKWAVNLASLADRESAREELARIRGLGLDAEIAAAPADGRTWYRIRVSGFDTAAAAKRYARSEAAGAGLGDAWVGRQ